MGTEFLWGVQQGPDVGFLLAGHWRMTEAMNVGFPCPTAGPVFKERKEKTGLKATVSSWQNKSLMFMLRGHQFL